MDFTYILLASDHMDKAKHIISAHPTLSADHPLKTGEATVSAWIESNNCSSHIFGPDEEGVSHYLIYPSTGADSYNGFYKQVLETSHDEIYVCDGEGRTLYCNKAFEKNYAIKRSDMLGKTAMYLVEHGYSDISPVPEVISSKKTVTLEQHTSKGRKLMITAVPYFDATGSISFIVENCRDITELDLMRKNLEIKEQEVQRYRAQLVKARSEQQGQLDQATLQSDSMKSLIHIAKKVAASDATVLLLGESGVGKNFIASFIHEHSPRKKSPFICINCSTIASNLFESELFGYAPGAFTGAGSKGKIGMVELAEGGTLFLDEIGEVPIALQVKLLELIQEKRYSPVGDVRFKSANVRIITATNRDLKSLIDKKDFREDLYYRLKVVELSVPPLRDRQEDIEGYLKYFLAKYNQEYSLRRQFAPETLDHLLMYQWPGNIRELQNLVHNLVLMAEEPFILLSDLPGPIRHLRHAEEGDCEGIGDLNAMLEEYERDIVNRFFKKNSSSYSLAKALKVSQSTASRLIRKHIAE